ncbi:MAG: archaeal proteasome endopeptidase complex subunit alpha [Candidatus Aenigmarchaeota archaeon]|nr:archaeal proteasome endopeptidase complex subunit alpha [Candidatus Aenigmarchaeota archaeon]
MANQPMPPSYMAYDRTIVVFSPDGRLLQVEYARQMVKNGSTSIGLKVKNAVVLGSVKMSMPLAVTESYKKAYEIDSHIAMVSSGSLADARNLSEIARVKAQVHKITYGEPISITTLTKELCNRKHLVTQYAGVRPYGVGLLVGGVDDTGPRLYETEPSGTMIEWKARAMGRGAQKAKKVLENNYKDNMTIEDGVKLILKTLKASEKDVNSETIDIIVVKENGVKKVEN